jgi:hypothetical protein
MKIRMKTIVTSVFAALFIVVTMMGASAAETCNSVASLQATCTGGTITTDTGSGCRTIKCTNGADSLQALACDKGSSYEVYKQTQVGTKVSQICVGGACVGNSGFAKSNYVCTTTQPTTVTQPVTQTTTTTNTCSSVQQVPVTCTSTITSDSWNGCRKVTCGTNGNTITTLACDKGSYFEVYKQGSTGTAPQVCYGTTCIQSTGYAKSGGFTCSAATTTTASQPAPTQPTTAATSAYPLKTGIVATTFWVGQGPSADTGWTNNYDSAWDTWWQEHYGGYDDPNSRNGWYPAGFTPKENPFYVAVPYTDFGYAGRKTDAFNVVPWADEKTTWGYQESMIKNRWVRITTRGKTVYAQVENSGPGPTDDWQYVFGSNAQPTTSFGWKAGIDVSPAVRDYLTLGPVDTVDWQWVDAKDVPSGPWKNIVTTRQSCWASDINHCV